MELKKQPLVTVITPLFNAERFIAETIQGVLNQTYQNFEMIIIDDCSSDNSINIVKEFAKSDSRLKLIESKENFGGPARPRNVGLDNAQGEYVAFLDADDVWLPSKLEVQLDILHGSEYDFVDSRAYAIDEKGKVISGLHNRRLYGFLKLLMKEKNIIFLENFININSVLIRNRNLHRFSEDKNLVALEDWLYWIDALHDGKKIHMCKEYLINYRVVDNSISNRRSDISYRKAFYMYGFLLLSGKIKLKYYFLSGFLNFFRLIIRRFNDE